MFLTADGSRNILSFPIAVLYLLLVIFYLQVGCIKEASGSFRPADFSRLRKGTDFISVGNGSTLKLSPAMNCNGAYLELALFC